MEGISKRVVASSKLVRFLVGPEKREFTIHAALVAHHSPVLDAMINSKLKESIDYTIKWDDIDEGPFISFWHFVYTGSYNNPEAQVPAEPALEEKLAQEFLLPEAKPMEEAEEAPTTEERIWRQAKSEVLWNDFRTSWLLYPSDLVVHEAQDIRDKVKSNGEVFIHHAQVYVLGDRYLIMPLMNMAFQKLHQALLEFSLNNNLEDIVALLHFCFDNSVPDQLRKLVVHYTACKVDILWKSEGFRELVVGSGEFSKALVESMLLRLD